MILLLGLTTSWMVIPMLPLLLTGDVANAFGWDPLQTTAVAGFFLGLPWLLWVLPIFANPGMRAAIGVNRESALRVVWRLHGELLGTLMVFWRRRDAGD